MIVFADAILSLSQTINTLLIFNFLHSINANLIISEDEPQIPKDGNYACVGTTNVYYYTTEPENEEGAMWWYYGDNGEILTKLLVTFNSNGGTDVSPQVTIFDGKITKPATPEKDYCEFEDWYIDSEFNNQ